MDENEVVEGEQEAVSEEAVDGAGSEAELMFKVGEKEYPREDVVKYIQAYENDQKWQARNTQRAQELAEMERGLSKAKQLEQYLNEHPEQYAQIEAMFKKQSATGQGSLPPEVMEQMERMKGLEQNLLRQNAAIELKNDLADIKERYADYFKEIPDLEKQLIKHMAEKDILDMNLALKDLLFDRAKESGLKQGQMKLAGAKKNSLSMGMPRGSKGMPVDLKNEVLKEKTMRGALSKYFDATDSA